MKNIFCALVCASAIFSASSHATLLFSEYVEGSSYNKALEIFNTGDAVDFSLDNYVINIYTNGASTPRYSLDLTGNIAEDGTYVVAHTSADTSLTSFADMLWGSLSFNGDDAITLAHNGVIVDRIGQVGVDPGSEWGTGTTSTQNNTLRRNTDVVVGDASALLVFDPAEQWMGFGLDEFSGLGSHSVVTGSQDIAESSNVSVPLPGSGALIAAGLVPLLLGGAQRRRREPKLMASPA